MARSDFAFWRGDRIWHTAVGLHAMRRDSLRGSVAATTYRFPLNHTARLLTDLYVLRISLFFETGSRSLVPSIYPTDARRAFESTQSRRESTTVGTRITRALQLDINGGGDDV